MNKRIKFANKGKILSRISNPVAKELRVKKKMDLYAGYRKFAHNIKKKALGRKKVMLR